MLKSTEKVIVHLLHKYVRMKANRCF